MDYKKIIRSRNMRLKLLKLFDFIPDKEMIKLQYRIKVGKKLNLKNPQRYTEKLQWYKLYYRDPLMVKCVDKYHVREYIESMGLGNILNDLYNVYDNECEINFNELPEQFVLKTTNGGGGNNIIICNNKNSFDEEKCRKQLHNWLIPKKKSSGREWVYENIKPRIIAERLLPRDSNNDLPDYKFFCFDGKVFCLYTMIDYTDNHENGKLGFFDTDFNQLPYRRLDFKPIDRKLEKPVNFRKMIDIAETLSKPFPHVRVDLYNINGQIVFGELTFFNASGYTRFEPDEFDFILGANFRLPK